MCGLNNARVDYLSTKPICEIMSKKYLLYVACFELLSVALPAKRQYSHNRKTFNKEHFEINTGNLVDAKNTVELSATQFEPNVECGLCWDTYITMFF